MSSNSRTSQIRNKMTPSRKSIHKEMAMQGWVQDRLRYHIQQW